MTIAVQDESLGTVLDKLFAGLDISYTLREKHIVLSKKAPNSPPPQCPQRYRRNRKG